MDTRIYTKTPKFIYFSDVVKNEFNLSATKFHEVEIPNKNILYVKNFLSRPLKRSDFGVEVGSLNYIKKSPYHFIRTKALQPHSFLAEFTNETALPITPNSFFQMNLKKGDLIISKDSNIGEIVILDKDYPNYMLSGALCKLPIVKKKYYLLAFIKHPIFREQLDYITPKGATIRHAKTMFLNCKIPMPNNNVENTISFIELLTKAIINKEQLIRQKHKEILQKINDELKMNQRPKNFTFNPPTYTEILNIGRLDTGLYSPKFKKYISEVENYNFGYYKNIYDMGFTLNRGQNLQESTIGKSIYSSRYYKSFYNLALPTNFSEYGTINKIIYLGNSKKLSVLSKGELVFGAEATFRSFVVCDDKEHFITNIHGIILKNNNLTLSIFVKCYLDYLVKIGIIDCIKVGAHGGSFAQKYWDVLPFPKFSETKQNEITSLYHNAKSVYHSEEFTLENFLEKDNIFNETAGIYELDKSAKKLKRILDKTIDNIINDREVELKF